MATKFGSREICNVVFKAKQDMTIGSAAFKKGMPVLYIDSAKTSSLEGATTSVYATGGRGNTRLVTWEGEKTVTFTVEDALLSPISFSMLSGAGVVKGSKKESDQDYVNVHKTFTASYDTENKKFDLSDALSSKEALSEDPDAKVYVMKMDPDDGSILGPQAGTFTVDTDGKSIKAGDSDTIEAGSYFIDCYVKYASYEVTELQISMDALSGNYYVEAETLFRNTEGNDLPAIFTLPNVKIQSNFTFSMASTGDPSTFTFTMDAMPAYTYFDKSKKVLCAIQVVDDAVGQGADLKTLFPVNDQEDNAQG